MQTWQRWPPFDSTVDWWSTTVDQWFDGDPAVVNGGSLLLIVVDRRHDLHRPPLTGGLVVALVTAPELYEVRQIQGSRMGYVARGD
ncbi:hypothetical protein Tco_0508442 [Tanacetum coccineum]